MPEAPYKFCPLCGAALTENILDQQTRLQCSKDDCDFVHWNNPVPVVAAIVEFDGKVVLARNAEWPEKMFGLITGFLEQGETPEEGIVREVKEELDLESTIVAFVGTYSAFQSNQLILAYHLTANGSIRLSEELVEYKLIEKHKLKPWPFATGMAVKDWLEGQKNKI